MYSPKVLFPVIILFAWSFIVLVILRFHSTQTNEGQPPGGLSPGTVLQTKKQFHLPEVKRQIKQVAQSTAAKRNAFNRLLGEEFDPEAYLSLQRMLSTSSDDPMKRFHFNQVASDKIAFNRVLWDVRNPMCKVKHSFAGNSTVSVVICFHNEARSALLRTVYSVLNMTPDELLKEVLLVDDFSDDPQDGYLLRSIPKVRVIRLDKREGLIRARLVGTQTARGRFLAFLDSHCEVTVGWLEPLITRVHKYRNHIVSPIIDIIKKDSMKYTTANANIKGGFERNLYFKWLKLTASQMEDRRKDITAPIVTPAIAGGLFVVEKEFFNNIGLYDQEMDIWGGENIELSLRTWMCGGQLEIMPCSHVGHIFRSSMPYGFGEGKTYYSTVVKNLQRTAEVWMGEKKDIFYSEMPEAKGIDYGNISARLSLKKALSCKSFEWYVDNIYPEFRLDYRKEQYSQVYQEGAGCFAVDKTLGKVVIELCELPLSGPSSAQAWTISKNGQIRNGNKCLTAVRRVNQSASVGLQQCATEAQDNNKYSLQLFTMEEETSSKKRIKNKLLHLCVQRVDSNILLQGCDSKLSNQEWVMMNLH